LRQLSHLELVSVILRGLRRAEAPLNFSKGFHPLPKVSFGPPLNVGVAGRKEYFDMEVFVPFDPEVFVGKLNETMPRGIVVDKMSAIPVNEPALSNFITRYEYHVTFEKGGKKLLEDTGSSSGSELAYFQFPLTTDVIVRRDGKETDLTPTIESVTVLEGSQSNGGGLSMKLILKDYDGVKVRIGEIVSALFGERAHGLTIVRTALYGWHDDWREPL
ncbi:MAG: TIGR03936 family radical SAM-associated protein, partial [Dissulfurispiraceae bacterium]